MQNSSEVWLGRDTTLDTVVWHKIQKRGNVDPPFLGQITMPGLTEINWLLLFTEMKAFGWVNHALINNFCTFGQHRQQTLSIFVRYFEKCAKRNICMLISKHKDNIFFAPGKNSPGSTHSYHSSILYFLIQFIYEIPVRFNMKFP